MADVTLSRAALGQVAGLGDLYDARTDTFPGFSMFKSRVPSEAVTQLDNHSSDIQTISKDSFSEKCEKLNVNAELQVSVLSGLCTLSGSGRYISDKKTSARCVRSSLIYNVKTKDEVVNVGDKCVQENVSLEALKSGVATHFVIGISWGANCMVTCEYANTNQGDVTEVEGNLSAELKKLSLSIEGNATVDFEEVDNSKSLNYSIKILGDILPQNQELPTTTEEALNLMKTMPDLLAICNSGKGKPLTYKLMPISIVKSYLNVSISTDCLVKSVDEGSLLQVVHIFDNIAQQQQEINDFHEDALRNKVCLRPQELASITNLVQKLSIEESSFRSKLANILQSIRSGRAQVSELENLIGESQRVFGLYFDKNQSHFEAWPSITEKINFTKTLIDNGAKYIGNEVSLDGEIIKEFHKKTFVLFLQEHAQSAYPETWIANRNLFFQEMKKGQEANFFVVDCNIHPDLWPKEDTILIQVLQNGQILTENLLAEHRAFGTSAWIKSTISAQRIISKPNKRVNLQIPCAGTNCINTQYEWFCWKCKTNIEYGFDNYFYCSCGKAHKSTLEFKCPGINHGVGFEKSEESFLDELISKLQATPFKELNILILGETGVGKSTWINGFYNFLKFKNLDEALKHDQLCSLIPTKFAHVDESFNEIVVRTTVSGAEHNEVHATGQSATQKCQTYLLNFPNLQVRIIDTPGIGDTRGYEQDKINFENILTTLSNYNDLHGICILLHPNKSKLTVMFKFCIKELLTHLHQDACRNIVFCFTNTRGTLFKPGDTLAPLRKLLSGLKDIEIPLTRPTVYCYDSEAFRFLAACKNNPPVAFSDEERKIFSTSWDKSYSETLRMIEHIKTLMPHSNQNTISLNKARNVILKLTRPLAEIRESIRTQQDVLNDRIDDIRRTRAKTEDLKKRATYMEPHLRIIEIEKPKTVCTNSKCKEYYGATKAIRYPNPCHNPCHLKGVTRDSVGHEGLSQCNAISYNFCRHTKCGHHYREHMHIYYETEEYMKEVEDEAITKLLKSSKSNEEKKNEMISLSKLKLQEYEDEYTKIQIAGAEFACFLKANAITPYNDEISEYLQHQIREAREKVAIGGDRRKLENLKSELRAYEEQVRTLEKSMESNHEMTIITPEKVEETIKKLYALKHNGKLLHEAMKAVLNAQRNEASLQESIIPYVVQPGSSKTGHIFFEKMLKKISYPKP